MFRSLILALLVIVMAPGMAPDARGHDVTAVSVVVDLKDKREYSIDISLDVRLVRDRAADGEPAAESDAVPLTPKELEEVKLQVEGFAAANLRFLFDEFDATPSFHVEEGSGDGEVLESQEGGAPGEGKLPRRRYLASAKGSIPEGASEFVLQALKEGTAPIILIIFRDGKPTRRSQVLYPGEFGHPVPLAVENGSAAAEPEARVPVPEAVIKSSADVSFFRCLEGGFASILPPKGWAHTLFVVGLFLLSRRKGSLAALVIAFTVAHSVTLALASLGMVSLSPAATGALVGLSVVWAGISIGLPGKFLRFLAGMAFGFGLFHGMRFAESLGALELPPDWVFPGLVGFNLGIELGQIAVIAGAWAVFGWSSDRPWFRKRVALPMGVLMALAGIYWTVAKML